MRRVRVKAGCTWLVVLVAVSFIAPAWGACNIVDDKAYGDCSGVTVNTGVTPPIVVTDNRSVSGIVEGATIRHGGHLIVSGTSGPITVEKGGSLSVGGVVNGNVINAGGSVDVSGMVNGLIVMNGGTLHVSGMVGGVTGMGEVQYESGAVIGGVPRK